MADTCVPLQLDLDSCMPKRLCCSDGGAVGYNQFGACPPNQGYRIDRGTCQCCRPACQPKDHRVTITVHRSAYTWQQCTHLGDKCEYLTRVLPSASITEVIYVSNPAPRVDIQEHAGWFGAGSCGCFGGSYSPTGHYRVIFDDGCPDNPEVGFSQINWHYGWHQGTDWTVAGQFYHTIDLVEIYDPATGTWG